MGRRSGHALPQVCDNGWAFLLVDARVVTEDSKDDHS
jgi:hypothetical protein